MSDSELTQEQDRRDLRFAERLGQLPPPALPPGLAARIVANATRLPQDRDEPAEMPAPSAPPERRGWRWLPHAVGTAIAASVVAALFLQQGSPDPAPRATQVQVAQQIPAPPLQDQPAGLVATPSLEPRTEVAAAPPTTPKPKAGKSAGHAIGPSPSPEPTSSPAAVQPNPNQTPELASEQNPPAKEGPAAQAFIGPPAIDDLGAPMLQSEPSSGFGISGTGVPGPPAPAPSRPGRGASTMPRF